MVPFPGIYLALVHSFSMGSHSVALFCGWQRPGFSGEGLTSPSSRHLPLGCTELYRQEGRYLSGAPEDMGECWFS